MRHTRREHPTFKAPPHLNGSGFGETAATEALSPRRPPSFLVLHVNGQSRALPIQGVREVAQADSVESRPGSPSWIRGALWLRGSRVPVVDLAVRLGEAPTPLGVSTCVVIAEVETRGRVVRIGLLADEDSRVTSARLPRWAVLPVDDLLDYEDLRDASVTGPDEARVTALGSGARQLPVSA
jgi:chemotaxis signal transduction protein